MKIRGGFVSNSSSSSFLVIHSNIADFDRFSGFTHLADLLDDLSKSTSDGVLSFIENLIKLDGHTQYFKYTHNYGTPYGINPTFDQLQELVIRSGADDSSYCEWLGRVSVAGFKVYEDNDVANTTYVYDKEWYQSYVNAWYDVVSKELDTLASELARAIADGLVANGYTASYVEYEDHDDYGSYMEHDFMPMLSADADRLITVVTINNH